MILFNSNYRPKRFLVPTQAKEQRWRLFLDSAADSPRDVHPKCDGPMPPKSGVLELEGKSVRLYVADD